ncbi:unnamed protein product [Calicophoron daubneyi]
MAQKKKKKHSKDVLKAEKIRTHKKVATTEIGSEKTTEHKRKHSHRDRSGTKKLKRMVEAPVVNEKAQKMRSTYETNDSGEPPCKPAPSSSDMQSQQNSGTPEPYQSPPRSSASPYSSRGSRSSTYSRSPESSSKLHAEVVQHPEDRYSQKRSREEAVDRDRSAGSRPLASHQMSAGYRRESRSRETSSEEQLVDSAASHFRRARSPEGSESSKPRYVSTSMSYGYRQRAVRHHDISPRRTFVQKRYYVERDRSRSSSRKPFRRDRRVEEEYHQSRRYLPSLSRSRVHGSNAHHYRASRESENLPHTSKHRSPRDMTTSHHNEHRQDSAEHDHRISKRKTSASPIPKASAAKSSHSEHRSRRNDDHTKKPVSSDSAELPSKPERQSSKGIRSSDSSDQGQTSAVTSTRAVSHKSATPPSALSSVEKEHKPRHASKILAVLDLLDGLQTVSLSDDELSTILPPTVFLTSEESTEIRSADQEDSSLNESKPSRPVTSNDQESAKSRQQEENAGLEYISTAADTMEKLSSQFHEKLTGPELWDSSELSPSAVDQDDYPENLSNEQSLVALATSKDGLPMRSRHLMASLTTPWQELIDSADKNLTPAPLQSENSDYVLPSMPCGNYLNCTMSDSKLVPLKTRAQGALVLRMIGVSRKYLGDELLQCLSKQLDELSHSGAESEQSAVTANAPSAAKLFSHDVAWLHRNPIPNPFVSEGTEDSSTKMADFSSFTVPSGILHSRLDFLLRQRLLSTVV